MTEKLNRYEVLLYKVLNFVYANAIETKELVRFNRNKKRRRIK